MTTKDVILLLGLAFVAFQFLLVMTVMAATRKPASHFKPEAAREPVLQSHAEEGLELAVH